MDLRWRHAELFGNSGDERMRRAPLIGFSRNPGRLVHPDQIVGPMQHFDVAELECTRGREDLDHRTGLKRERRIGGAAPIYEDATRFELARFRKPLQDCAENVVGTGDPAPSAGVR